ncbi:MAG: hypothetical protein QOI78_6212, partial [Actinomycetota bacterium]|nr:hypothetical protein [Actinomycetota bacterium]
MVGVLTIIVAGVVLVLLATV